MYKLCKCKLFLLKSKRWSNFYQSPCMYQIYELCNLSLVSIYFYFIFWNFTIFKIKTILINEPPLDPAQTLDIQGILKRILENKSLYK